MKKDRNDNRQFLEDRQPIVRFLLTQACLSTEGFTKIKSTDNKETSL